MLARILKSHFPKNLLQSSKIELDNDPLLVDAIANLNIQAFNVYANQINLLLFA